MEYKEILKLIEMLEKENINFSTFEDDGGHIVKVPIMFRGNKIAEISVIQHDFSYGNKEDLIEIMGGLTESEMLNDSVLGHLTAAEVIKRIKYCVSNITTTYREDEKKIENGPTKIIVDKIINYIRSHKPIDLWGEYIADLKKGKYSSYIACVLGTFDDGPLLKHAYELLETFDKVEEEIK